MNIELLLSKLKNPDLQCYTVVRMAINDLVSGDITAAITRLKVDADKLRMYDITLYNMIVNW